MFQPWLTNARADDRFFFGLVGWQGGGFTKTRRKDLAWLRQPLRHKHNETKMASRCIYRICKVQAGVLVPSTFKDTCSLETAPRESIPSSSPSLASRGGTKMQKRTEGPCLYVPGHNQLQHSHHILKSTREACVACKNMAVCFN